MSDRDRDQSVEQWLRRTPVGAPSTHDCLDADTLAAWSEGLLEGAERSSAESHASTCARCQAMLAVMARTTPVPASGTASPIRKWLMLLGPAMAAAAAVALWFAVDPSQRSAPSVLGELSKERAESAPATVPAREPAASPASADKDRPSTSQDSLGRTQEAAALEGQTRARQRDERVAAEQPRAPINEKKGEADKRVETNPSAAPSGALAPPPPPPPAAPVPPTLDRTQDARGNLAGAANSQSPSQSQSVQVQSPPVQTSQAQSNQAQDRQAPQANQAQSPPPPRQQGLEERVVVADSPGSRVTARRDAAAPAESARFLRVAATLEIRTPDPAVRWRVVDGRLVQRSLDAGATWVDQYRADEGVTLTAGVAPSTTACWLVGRAGAIVRTIDGRAWQRVRFPEPLDFTAVVAGDARTATVTAADGRQFATTDGGTTWTRR
ncbi:MAG: hypothetical protein ABWY12_01580 [Burkholderiales bacterium]